jgi:hypothetical protein
MTSPASSRLCFLIAAAFILSSCGSTQQAGQAMQATWIGKRADDFFVKQGAAQRDQRLSDGRRVYVWETSSNASMGGPKVWCSADIVASVSGIITEIRPREDSIGLWNTSRCSEIFNGS